MANTRRPDFICKIAVVGSPRSGKTKLRLRYVSGEYDDDYDQRVADLSIKKEEMSLGGERFVQQNIFEKSSISADYVLNRQEVSASVNAKPGVEPGYQAIIVTVDLTDEKSVEWARQFIDDYRKTDPHSPIVLVGTKSDFRSETINRALIWRLLDDATLNITYFEVSSKGASRIKEPFKYAVESVWNARLEWIKKIESLGTEDVSSQRVILKELLSNPRARKLIIELRKVDEVKEIAKELKYGVLADDLTLLEKKDDKMQLEKKRQIDDLQKAIEAQERRSAVAERNKAALKKFEEKNNGQEEFRFFKKKPALQKEDILGRLAAYCDRISIDKVPNEFGENETDALLRLSNVRGDDFRIMKEQQLRNRQANYFLARVLHSEMKKLGDHPDPKKLAALFTDANLRSIRAKSEIPGLGKVRSAELNQIIRDVQQSAKKQLVAAKPARKNR